MQEGNGSLNGSGYERRSVQFTSVKTSMPMQPLDSRWSRLQLAQFQDAAFLTREMKRMEMIQSARRSAILTNGETLASCSVDKRIEAYLKTAQVKGTRIAFKNEEVDDGVFVSEKQTLSTDSEKDKERELMNALCVLGTLQQPEMTVLIATKLKKRLQQLCTFDNPVYELIAVRRQLMKNMHEAVITQHQQTNATCVSIIEWMENNNSLSKLTFPDAREKATIKVDGKVNEKAGIPVGIQVLVSLLGGMDDSGLIAPRRDFLHVLLPVLDSADSLSLSPLSANWSDIQSSESVPDLTALTDKIQRFLFDMCTRPISKLPLFSSENEELDGEQGRTSALNGLIRLAGATGSVRDFIVLVQVLLGATDPPMSSQSSQALTVKCLKLSNLPHIQSLLLELHRMKPLSSTQAKGHRANSSTSDVMEYSNDDAHQVWTCGQNAYGELGLGDTMTRRAFERVHSLEQHDIVQIAAGNEHTIVLTRDGTVFSCGYNENGQCGLGGTARVPHFDALSTIKDQTISHIHASNGCEHSIFVTLAGHAATCGFNIRGQLGHGTTSSESVPRMIQSLEKKVVQIVSCSYFHTALTCQEKGSSRPSLLYTFGRNDYGQLGHNDAMDRKIPHPVVALKEQEIISIACGQYHTIVVTATGQAFAFGKNDYGQLGIDSLEPQWTPRVITGLETQQCLEVACGYYHTIVRCTGAHLFGFGRNDYGQLGLSRPHSSPTTTLNLQQERFTCPQLIQELEGKDIVQITCGCYHTIAVSENGMMYVFGRNNHGQLGTGDTKDRLYPFQIDEFVGKRVVQIAAGFYHTVVLTGGNEEQVATAREDREEFNKSTDFTSTKILSSSIVQEVLDIDTTTSAIEDDSRNENSPLETKKASEKRHPTPATNAVLVAVIILAHLDRLCHSILPRSGTYPRLRDPSINCIESLTKNPAAFSASSFEANSHFQGSFQPFTIHCCSSTFDNLVVLIKHLSSHKLDISPQVLACFEHLSTEVAHVALELQMYLLLACMRLLEANLSHFLKCGMAKAMILLSSSRLALKKDSNRWTNELDPIRLAIDHVQDLLIDLMDVKHRKNILDLVPDKGNAIVNQAIVLLMQGFELFFPCQCLQRRFFRHVIGENVTIDKVEPSCGVICLRDQCKSPTYPHPTSFLLTQLVRRMSDERFILCLLPRYDTKSDDSVTFMSELYRATLSRIALDASSSLRDSVAFHPFFHLLERLQKHLSTWAASIDEWVLNDTDTLEVPDAGRMEADLARLIGRVFHINDKDLAYVPIPWRCLIEFSLAIVYQSCDILLQFLASESLLNQSVLETLEFSLVGQCLPSLITTLFAFSNAPLFAAVLLPPLKTLLRLIDRLNGRNSHVDEVEKKFVDSIGSRREFWTTLADAMVLPWNYRLEKEVAILATEMAMTLVSGDPFFTLDTGQENTKLSKRWVTSSLFRGGFNATYLTQSIQQTDTKRLKTTQTIQHSPFPVLKAATFGFPAPSFSLVLPPSSTRQSCQLGGSSLTSSTYGTMFRSDLIRQFLRLLQQDTATDAQRDVANAALKLCDWIRESYAKTDPSYRMLLRQAQASYSLQTSQPSQSSIDQQLYDHDTRMETAFFAALVHFHLLGPQVYHFALQFHQSSQKPRVSPPQIFVKLWQTVAHLRRHVASKKVEIKNNYHPATRKVQSDPILALQGTIVGRCKLLLLLDVYEEQEHVFLEMDAGFIAPYDPAFLQSASTTYNMSSSSSSVKQHLNATYTAASLPFLAAYPFSKWKLVRILLHTTIRWKSMTSFSSMNEQAQEILAYVTSRESISSTNAIKTLLVDPCRRASCSIRGLETLQELVTIPSFASIQADIVYQIIQVFVFQSSTSPPSMLTKSPDGVGYFFSTLKLKTWSNFSRQVTELLTEKAASLMHQLSRNEASSTFWIVLVMFSAWGMHFNHHHFEFVRDIGILNVIQELARKIASIRSVLSMEKADDKEAKDAPLTVTKQLDYLEETLWVLLRYIFVHFATQYPTSKAVCAISNQNGWNVPTFPVLSSVFELLYTEAVAISADYDTIKSKKAHFSYDSPALQQSLEIISTPHRFSQQRKGITFTFDDLVAPSASMTANSLSSLMKSTECSVTFWLYINKKAALPQHTDGFKASNDCQLVFLQGAGSEISLYLALIRESLDKWRIEVGIRMARQDRMWERLASKQSLEEGTWIHVAIVVETSQLRLYLNGLLDSNCSLATKSRSFSEAGTVDLLFHFGSLPTRHESESLATSTLASSMRSFSRFLGRTESEIVSSLRGLPCLDGWLSHFRFHNRSLPLIHVQSIVSDDKMSIQINGKDTRSFKLIEFHALVILFLSSSEGCLHFTSAFSQWMKWIWKTFLTSKSTVLQQSALRVLQALLPFQVPFKASKAIRDNVQPDTFGFYSHVDMFVQQLIRMIGFCITEWPRNPVPNATNDALEVPSSLMMACGIHAHYFSPEAQDTDENRCRLDDEIELRYQRSKRQSLLLANELSLLLKRLFGSNEAWKQSILRVLVSSSAQLGERMEKSKTSALRFGKQCLNLSEIKSVEASGCLYLVGGGIEFLRPGVSVELQGSKEYAQVLSIEKPTAGSKADKPLIKSNSRLAYVHIERTSSAKDFDMSTPCPVYTKVNVNELQLTKSQDKNSSWSLIYEIASLPVDYKLFSVVLEKANAMLLALYSFKTTRQERQDIAEDPYVLTKVCSMLLKILVQIAGTIAGVQELLALPTLLNHIMELAVSEDGNPYCETVSQVEQRVSALRQEVRIAILELGNEGEQQVVSEFTARIRARNGYKSEHNFLTSRDPGSQDLSDFPSEIRDDSSRSNEDDEDPDSFLFNSRDRDEVDTQFGMKDEDSEEDKAVDEEVETSLDEEEEDEEAEGFQTDVVDELMVMGFPEEWCLLALKKTDNDLVNASAWIVENLECLSKLQATLDRDRDKSRETFRLDEEEEDDEDDSSSSDDIARRKKRPSLARNPSDDWIVRNNHDKYTEEIDKDNPHAIFDKETGRKLFREMYFPFEDGGFLSNTKSRFLCSWKTEAIERKRSSKTASASSECRADDKASSFPAELNRLDLASLCGQLQRVEHTLSVLYARQCLTTLLYQTTFLQWTSKAAPHLIISYVHWLKLLKLVMLRGDQFIVHSMTENQTIKSLDVSLDQVFSKAFKYFLSYDMVTFTTAVFDFCLNELEAAAFDKRYQGIVWTQRTLSRPDTTVLDEPGIELVTWMLEVVVFSSTNPLALLSIDFITTILRRLRRCLDTTNLPVKLIVLRFISRLLIKMKTNDQNILNTSQLVFQDIFAMANNRHDREVIQTRLLFSPYLHGYIELLYVLQRFEGFQESNNNIQPLLTDPCHAPSACRLISPSNLLFDRIETPSSLISIAENGQKVSYTGHQAWTTVRANRGFSTGHHTWTFRIETSSSRYLFVGVATRQVQLDSFLGSDNHSWGFMGDKGLYYQRNRIREYGEPFVQGDCIGVHLDCEKGELSFRKNGLDLGVAFDNVVGEVYPALSFYSRYQTISFENKSYHSHNIRLTGEDDVASVQDCLIACEIMTKVVEKQSMRAEMIAAASQVTTEWLTGSRNLVTTLSGKFLWLDVTHEACRQLGYSVEDRVQCPRGNGRVVGVAAGRVWVQVDDEKGAWFYHSSKLQVLSTVSSTRTQSSTLISLSLDELSEYGEHSLWTIARDRELIAIVNDFCEKSRLCPWNLRPIQLLHVVNEKTAVLEQTCFASILEMSRTKLEKMIIARFALLRFWNIYLSRALPFFDLTWHYFMPQLDSLPCQLISQCRGSLFLCVKNTLWDALMAKTATSPTTMDDEYDYPQDLPLIQVNRLKAATAKCHERKKRTIDSLFHSLFGQAFEELHFLPPETLRMVYSHPMDDGQLRSFKVKFEGEGVDDYGGPYREFFSQFFAELQMFHLSNAAISVSSCVLPFLIPSPNWRNGVGTNREKFVLNGALVTSSTRFSLPGETVEATRELYSQMFYFLGQMIGICLRSRVCVRLDLAMAVWKQLVAETDSSRTSSLETLKEIDFVAYSQWKILEKMAKDIRHFQELETRAISKLQEIEDQLNAMDLVFTTVLSDGQTIELCENGSNIAVKVENVAEFVDAMLQARLHEMQTVLNIVKQGLHSILPVAVLSLLTWTELEKRMCGVAEVDVRLLQDNTEYEDDLSPNDEFIQRFWRVLESFEEEDKRAFLRFVWARSRLPLNSTQFHQKFKIQALASGDRKETDTSGNWMDTQMPKAHTCFFALQLPRYSSDEICQSRLLYAIRNCLEMDGDFRLADSEMTGWRDSN